MKPIPFRHSALVWPALLTTALALTACGGNGGGSSSPTPGGQLIGTAATGAAAANALVSVTDRAGSAACLNVPLTTDSQGAYSCQLKAQVQGPLAIVVTDPTGLISPMISLLSIVPDAGASATANVSPLTTAIAAQVASGGDAFAFANEPASLATLDTTELETVTDNVVAQLANVLISVGLDPATFDPFTSSFVGGSGTGADALLDQVRVTLDAGTPHLSNVLNPSAPAVPLADAQTSIPPTVSASAVTTPFSVSELDIVQTEMQGCFAVPSASRAPNPDAAQEVLRGMAVECQNFVAATGIAPNVDVNFLHSGYLAPSFFYGLMTSSDMDGARFNRPELMRYQIASDGRDLALLNIKFVDRNGYPGNRILTAKKFPGSRPEGESQWWLIGNQRPVNASVQVLQSRLEQTIPTSILNGSSLFPNAPFSRYEVGFNIFVQRPNNGGTVNQTNNPNNAVRYVRVTGPGLPNNGMVLADVDPDLPQTWMNFLNATGTIPTTASPQLAGSVGNHFRVQRTRGVTGTDATTLRPNSTAGSAEIESLTQAQPIMYGLAPDSNWIFNVSSVPAWSEYRLEFFCGTSLTPCHDFTTRITTPLVPASTLANQAWHSLTAASRAAVSDGAPAASDVLIAWTPNVLSESVSSVNAYSWGPDGDINSASAGVPPGIYSRTVSAVGGQFPALSLSSGNSGRNLQLRYLMFDGSTRHQFTRFN